MHAYLNLLERVLRRGKTRTDRTGVGTKSLFGQSLVIDLHDGLPLLTTKKLHIKSIVTELLWFVRGDTNIKYLQDNGVSIWNEWADDNGDLGPIYGRQLREIDEIVMVDAVTYERPSTDEYKAALGQYTGSVFGVAALGDYNKKDPYVRMLQPVWREMIRRCFWETALPYRSYGGVGIHVDPRWMLFSRFLEDVQKLPRWDLKRTWPSDYSLDKDIRAATNRYGPSTCMWATRREQSLNTGTSRPFIGFSPRGKSYLFSTFREAEERFALNPSAVHRCLNRKLQSHHGWRFRHLVLEERKKLRFTTHDQLREGIAAVIHRPDSRRIVACLWNPQDIRFMALPPCHGIMIQFCVVEGKLSTLMVQRSADVFLGLPYNIASYAMLTHMVARMAHLDVGELHISIGDAHLYTNHVAQAEEQLRRAPRALPSLRLNPDKEDLFQLSAADISISGYNPHPAIKAPVAV